MPKRRKDLDKPQKIRTTVEELEILSHLKESIEWSILKRVMKRYIMNMRSISFNMSYALKGEDFKVYHRDLTARAKAYKDLVRIIEKSGKKLEEMEK